MRSRSADVNYPLRLSATTRKIADELARKDGVSLNTFIQNAVSEKIGRMQAETERLERNADTLARSIHT